MKIIRTEYRLKYGKPLVYAFCRNDQNEREVVIDGSIRPYFYVLETDAGLAQVHGYEVSEHDYVSDKGENLCRVYVGKPTDMYDARPLFDKDPDVYGWGATTWEADVNFPIRYMIDCVKEIEPCFLRIMFIDIEIDNLTSNPEPDTARKPITAITVFDNGEKAYTTFAWKADGSEVGDDVGRYDGYRWNISILPNEEAMMDSFFECVKESEPDVITGWWSNGFDLPYIINRAYRLHMSPNRMSPMGSVMLREEGDPMIKGVSCLDLLAAYKKVNENQEESYSLEYVSNKELGTGKVKDIGNIGNFWREDFWAFINYNVMDVSLIRRLEEKLGLIEFLNQLRCMCFCQLEDTITATRTIDCYLLKFFHNRIVFPTKDRSRQTDKFEGAVVINDSNGIHENIVCLDLKSLYPSLLVTANLSPETVFLPEDAVERDGDYIAIGKVNVDMRKPGFLPELVDSLFAARAKYKNEMKKQEYDSDKWTQSFNRQRVVKEIMNCFTPDTDIITTRGIVNIKDIRVGDVVYNADPNTHEVVTDTVLKTYKYDHAGDIYEYLDMLQVTPEHRFLVEGFGNFKTIQEIYEYGRNHERFKIPSLRPLINEVATGDYISLFGILAENDGIIWLRPPEEAIYSYRYISIPGTDNVIRAKRVNGDVIQHWRSGFARNLNAVDICELFMSGWQIYGQITPKSAMSPVFFDKSDFLSFLGWFVSEGNTYRGKPKKYNNSYRGTSFNIQITQKKNLEYIDEIYKLIQRMGFRPRRDSGVAFASELMMLYLEKNIGKYAEHKNIPTFIFDETYNNIQLFYESLYKGDGTHSANRYTTKSLVLATGVVQLLTLMGNNNIRLSHDGHVYRIRWTNYRRRIGHRNVIKTKYDGKVYSLSTKNSTVFAGRNGNFTITGQSVYGQCAYSGSRIFSPLIAETITYMGRETILWTKKQLEDLKFPVRYVDTDSCLFEYGGKPDLNHIAAIVTGINKSYGDLMAKYGIKEHRLELEFEKIYRRIFWAKVKKRYAGHLVLKDGQEVSSLETKGFELRRSDSPMMSRNMQRRVFEMILIEDGTKSDVLEYINTLVTEVMTGKIPIDELGIPKGIGKSINSYREGDSAPAQIRGVRYALEHHNHKLSTKPKMLYIHPLSVDPPIDVICYDKESQIPKGAKVDMHRMLDRLIEDKIKNIFEGLGWPIGLVTSKWRYARGRSNKKLKKPKEQGMLLL